MSTPLVSVITPSYNQAAFIGKTLHSVRDQRYSPVEHLVLDAGSTDGTLEILGQYAGTYDLRWQVEPDRGMYDAVNKGLKLARGEIVTYLNTDDKYFPWTLATVVAAFRRHPEADFVYGDVVKIDDADGSRTLVFAPPFRAAFVQRLGSLFQPAVFWRRTAMERLDGFDDSLRFGGDLDLWNRAAQRFRFEKVNEVLAVERLHPAAKTTAFAAEAGDEEARIRARYERLSSSGAALSRLAERARVWAWRRAYWLAFADAARAERTTGSWGDFIQAARPRVHPASLLAAQLPIIGKRFASRAVELGQLEALE